MPSSTKGQEVTKFNPLNQKKIMAGFTKQQLENLKFEPENLASIKDAVQETFYNDEDFSSFVNIQKVKEKDPIALLGEMEW